MAKNGHSSTHRIRFVDIARIYGVFFVYYGHIIESYMKAGSEIAAIHYKFVYSFHMPLFFILSGYIAKTELDTVGFPLYLKWKVASRLVPYLFFSILLIIPTFWTTGFTVGLELPSAAGYIKGIAATTLAGFPYFNIPTWFLICLFMVEMMHYVTSRFLTTQMRILLIAVGFYLIGSILAWNAGFLRPTNILAQHGKIYPYFMLLEAFTGYSLYLVGVFLRHKNFLDRKTPVIAYSLGALVSLILLFLTFDLNKGMFLIPFYDAVILVASSHGNPILFPLSALLGSIFILILARLTPDSKKLVFLGGNTLVIFGLNGVFYHFINDRLASWLLPQYSGNFMAILISGAVIACLSIILTVPFVLLFNRFIPQLIGKPKMNGPIFPRLLP